MGIYVHLLSQEQMQRTYAFMGNVRIGQDVLNICIEYDLQFLNIVFIEDF